MVCRANIGRRRRFLKLARAMATNVFGENVGLFSFIFFQALVGFETRFLLILCVNERIWVFCGMSSMRRWKNETFVCGSFECHFTFCWLLDKEGAHLIKKKKENESKENFFGMVTLMSIRQIGCDTEKNKKKKGDFAYTAAGRFLASIESFYIPSLSVFFFFFNFF